MNHFEVGVIGAGVHGASAAFHLAGQGTATVLIDRATPAAGPTGRSSAICRATYTNEFLAGVAREGMSMLQHFQALTGRGWSEYRQTGMLVLHDSLTDAEIRAVVERLGVVGVTTEYVARDAIAESFPRLNLEGVVAGQWEPCAGYADPSGTTLALVESAVERGLETRMNCRVTALRATRTSMWEIKLDKGDVLECERVLIAAGPWSGPLARQVGADLPLSVERHVVATYAWGEAEPFPHVLSDLPGGYYLKPEGDDLFLLGPVHEAPEVDPDACATAISDAESLVLGEAAARRVAGLDEAEQRPGWASLYDMSPDWQPVIGEIADGVFIDAGTSGHGFKLAPALGRHVADLILGRAVDPGLAQFHPDRFARGHLLTAGFGAAKILG